MKKWLGGHDEWWVFFDPNGDLMVSTADPRGVFLNVWHDQGGAHRWRQHMISTVGTSFMSSWEPRRVDRRTVCRFLDSHGCRFLALGHTDSMPGAVFEDVAGKGWSSEVNAPAAAGKHSVVHAGEGCVSGCTLVVTPNRSVPIRAIAVAQRVMAWDARAKRLIESEVVRVLAHPRKQTILLTLAGSQRPARVTPAHLVTTGEGWQRAGRLRAGDEVLRFVGGIPTWTRVLSIEAACAEETVFNLHLRHHHTWLADGLISHSFSWFPAARALLADLSMGLVEGAMVRTNQTAWTVRKALRMP